MNRGRSISPAEVDFWLDLEKYADYFSEHDTSSPTSTLVFNVDMVKLASIRKAISNFVRILTRRNIPVYFTEEEDSLTNGKIVHISAKLNNKQDFDVAVGLALHEGAHCLKTNYDIIKIAFANVPHSIWQKSDAKNIRRNVMEKFLLDTLNVVEDRYIDDYIFRTAPGYRGYYAALYDRYFHNPTIDEYLKSDYCRYPSLKSYDFRITSLVNENTDLMALPRLDEIADVIDIENISRLKTTKDRINVAFQVVEIVLDCIDKDDQSGLPLKGGNASSTEIADPRDYFDFGDDEGESDDKGEEKKVDMEKKMMEEISDAMSGRDKNPENPKDNSDAISKISRNPVPTEVQTEIDSAIAEQRKFVVGEVDKEAVTPEQKSLLDLIEKHGIILVRVDAPNLLPGDNKNLKVDCIVVQTMTKELILLGEDIFPLSSVTKIGKNAADAPEVMVEAINKGIQLGTKLGRKLQIRAEVNPYKIVRKKSGKINRRQLHEASFDSEDLFYKIQVESHNDATMHITVDASSSMNGQKWYKTMIAVVAICKAASMIDNIHITVSFRSTQNSGKTALPYIILAYDSKVDKFSKIKTLFPYLQPNGCTPEGLAFSAIMNLFDSITPDEEDRYFLNFSDGEPYYSLSIPKNGVGISYTGEVGVMHTKSQVDKIRNHGVEILSYFIEDGKSTWRTDDAVLQRNFKKMYGKSAKFIDVESVVDLAFTINGLFLSRGENKTP